MDIRKIGSSLNSNMTTDKALQAAGQAEDSSFGERLNAAIEKNDDKELKKACKQFEGIMLDLMYKQMRATVNKSELDEADPGREIFESMLDEMLVEKASEASTFGLAESLYKQLSKRTGPVKNIAKTETENNEKAGKPIE